jgi:hypothetical protein
MFHMDRREKTFPVRFEITNPTRFSPGEMRMFYAHEWEAYRKTLYSDAGPRPAAGAQPDVPLPHAQIIAPPLESLLSRDDDATSCSAAPPSDHELSSPSVMSSASSNPAPVVSPISAPVAASGVSSTSSTSFASSASGFAPPDFARHAQRCAVCSHPDRDAIEADFIRWRSPQIIAREYGLSDRASVYRHAHSTGLFRWRRRELGRVLEGILESAEHIPLEFSDVIIRAARIYAHLDESGNWSEPSRVNFLLTGPASSFRPASAIEPLPQSPSRRRPGPKEKSRPRENSRRAAARRPNRTRAADRNSRPKRHPVKSMEIKEKANA